MSHTDEAPRVTPLSAIAPPATRRTGDGPTGKDVLAVLLAGRWLILGCVALALALAGAYVFVATPRWRAEALVRIEERERRDGDPVLGALDAPSPKAEIEVLRARTLLVEAVERLGLDVVAGPRRVPFLGKALARLHRGPHPAQPLLGLARFAWGGERISIGRLELPDPIVDVPLVLTAEEDGRFHLATRGGAPVIDGAVGRLAEGTDPAGRPIRVLVSEFVARPGTEFLVRKLRVANVVADLQMRLTVEERGKDTGIVALRLEGADRTRIVATLGAMLDAYLRQNAERSSARAVRTLAVLEARLPALKANVERAEAAVESWKLRNGTIDVSATTSALLARSVDAERRLSDLEARRTELLGRRSETYPDVVQVGEQIEALRIQQKLVDAKLRALPGAELQIARLTRDVHAATALYLQVLERSQQYRIAASGSVGTAAIVDPPATPEKPLPNPVVALALLVGLLAGVGAAAIKSRLGGAGDPAEVEAATGLAVLGTVPHSSTEASLVRSIRRRITGARAPALHAVNPGDGAVEDLRALRTNLCAALRGAPNNIVAIGGPSPGVGKSLVCVNLALLLASTRRKVLIVDGDLRRGRLHREFGLQRSPGLAEALSGEETLDKAIRPSSTEGLDVLSAGEIATDPTALLESARLPELLAEAGKRYDVVIVDTAAILAVTDPALVARHAGLSLLVLRAGEHPVEVIAHAVKRLRQGGARVDGAILNDLRPTSRHGRYRYEYRARAGA